MHRVLCSTGALITKRNGRDYELLRAIVPQLSCDGLEFMMYQSWHDRMDALQRVLSEFPVPVFHMTKQIGEWISQGMLSEAEDMFREDCALARAIGSQLLVLHLWSGVASDQHIERNVTAYPSLREIADHHGLRLTVENVVCNTQDPMTHLRALAEVYRDVAFTFDTKMAAFHSQLDALYDPANAWLLPRIAHFHVNDYGGGHMDWAHMAALPLGQGRIDLDRFFAHVRGMGYQGDFTCEATALEEEGAVRYDEMNANLRRIRQEVAP
ncbi:MAG: TIM barrel protein [Clostridiales bacterium]|nr:TIM barrel protein [Clostridiales bacterium]